MLRITVELLPNGKTEGCRVVAAGVSSQRRQELGRDHRPLLVGRDLGMTVAVPWQHAGRTNWVMRYAQSCQRSDAGAFEEIDMQNAPRYAVIPAGRLEQAERSVTVDPDIMGGLPVFSGTRLPIETVASAKAAGSSDECLIAAYPFLTPALIHDAEIYQRVHPHRGLAQRLGELNPGWTILESKTVRLGRSTPAHAASAPLWPAIITFSDLEALHEQLGDALYGGGLIDARSGLILLDPIDAESNQSRTAKSRQTAVGDSLIGRLITLAEQRGWAKACADLSGQGEADPSVCVTAAVRASMSQGTRTLQSPLRQLLTGRRPTQLDRSISASKRHSTLSSLLSAWYVAVRHPLLLILHEPQSALSTVEGRNMLAGVRAALDSMNSVQAPPRLMVLLNAVDMDGLSGLGTHSRAPFFGAAIVAYGQRWPR